MFRSEGDRMSCGLGEARDGEERAGGVAGRSKSAKETVCGPFRVGGRAFP